jgi:5-methyltetrahydropteroyltriglutamate--homocysteine methyltransferase
MVGAIDLNDVNVETPEQVVARIKRALPYVKPGNVIVAPDCGMKYLPQDVAFGKLLAMVEAAKILRIEFAGKI